MIFTLTPKKARCEDKHNSYFLSSNNNPPHNFNSFCSTSYSSNHFSLWPGLQKLCSSIVFQLWKRISTSFASQTTSTSFTDVTGVTVDITPAATSSKILIIASIQVGGSATVREGLTLVRDSTDIYLGDAAGSRAVATIYINPQSATVVHSASIVFLDSPSSTSATTYKIQAQTESGNTLTINRSLTDTDSATYYRTPSSITVMEVLV